MKQRSQQEGHQEKGHDAVLSTPGQAFLSPGSLKPVNATLGERCRDSTRGGQGDKIRKGPADHASPSSRCVQTRWVAEMGDLQ